MYRLEEVCIFVTVNLSRQNFAVKAGAAHTFVLSQEQEKAGDGVQGDNLQLPLQYEAQLTCLCC